MLEKKGRAKRDVLCGGGRLLRVRMMAIICGGYQSWWREVRVVVARGEERGLRHWSGSRSRGQDGVGASIIG